MKGSSTASTVIDKSAAGDDPVPLKTARLSRFRFSYAFQVNHPGQKILRLHFNPAQYKGFKSYKDLFAVEAGPFTLLSNFSASLTAIALGVSSFVKEYCISVQENQLLDIVFSPASSQSFDTYAFVNGVEIISAPAGPSYFQGGAGIAAYVSGKSQAGVDYSTALEVIRRLNLKRDSVALAGGIHDLSGMRETGSKQKAMKMKSITWKTSLDVGFRYLVRLRFSQVELKMAETGGIIFEVRIDNTISNTSIGIVKERNDENITPWYRDYMVMMKGQKREGRRDLLIRLQSNEEFVDGDGPLKGFEIMKLSNSDNSLASPNPFPSIPHSSYWAALDLYQVLGHKNMIATVAIALLALVNVIIYTLNQIWEARYREERNMPPVRVGRLCRRFSLAEIQLATRSFSDAHLIGKGGFGNVYRGVIDNGRETVAIKRQKSNSKQGTLEFLTEIETLTQLLHVNLVSLIGYCNEHGELILVYEYMAHGTLADHIFNLSRSSDNCSSLTWKQRLLICIGAGRGLDYLHTGSSIIHRDVKASNILLGENFMPKVSDFGLGKHLSIGKLESHVSTKVKGTFGYFDPSYFTTGRLTRKSDIYAFGVVLLEVLCGRLAVDPFAAEDERSLIVWARENISEGKTDQIVASNLKGEISEDSLKTFLEIAERCLLGEPKKRPTMAQVVLQLELALEQQESSDSLVPNRRTSETSYIHPSKRKNGQLPTASSHAFLLRHDSVVGFEDEEEKLIVYLTEETQELDVISIIGMHGLGKTTIARKIFHDPQIRHKFPIRIWVSVSDLTKKEAFLAILKEFTWRSEEIYWRTDQELAQLVAYHLEREKFLIVMDNVQATKDWYELQIALPRSNKMGKVLITSHDMEVAFYASGSRDPHKLHLLTAEESWLLLRLVVFGKPECPPELEVYGKLIVEQCGRLPLAIVIMGGILVKKFSASDGMNATKNSWRKVYEKVNTYLNDDLERRIEKIVSLSYDKLPFHLKSCFLYLGMFPKGFEIPVWKLIRMWIAEGFILQKTGLSLEESAEKYLEDLISRNLIRIDKIKLDGKVKTCRVDGMIHDFCKLEAGIERENFLQEIKQSSAGAFEPPVFDIQKYDRLCIHTNVFNFILSKPYGPHVRSFVSFSDEDFDLPTECSSAIPEDFKRLRVFDVKPMKFIKIPRDFYQMVHLSYLALYISLSVLPEPFSKLWNLQTLIVETSSRTFEIKADIWKLIQLRHLTTNASATLSKTSKSSGECEILQTLGTLSPQSCTEEVLQRARNLKKLGIRGRLSLLLDSKTVSFDSLGRLSNLEKLKLVNDVFPSPPSEGILRGLPPPYKFPPNLRSLTLSETSLDWRQMYIIGLLENLEVLKLRDKAFMGECWMTDDGGFRNLEVLHIGRTNLAIWLASGHHFPRLRRVELRNCENLQAVPIGLADIPSLQVLDLYRSKRAAASARKINKAKQKQQKEQTTKVGAFKVSIFPPEN